MGWLVDTLYRNPPTLGDGPWGRRDVLRKGRRMETELVFWCLFFTCGCVWLMARYVKEERTLLDDKV